MLIGMNRLRLEIYIKIALFNILVHVQLAEQTLFNFLILGKPRFPPKCFITSTTSPKYLNFSSSIAIRLPRYINSPC